jgi:hypothetical protein
MILKQQIMHGRREKMNTCMKREKKNICRRLLKLTGAIGVVTIVTMAIISGDFFINSAMATEKVFKIGVVTSLTGEFAKGGEITDCQVWCSDD